MGKSKGARIIITLECECRSDINRRKNQRKPGIFRYTTTKNRRNTPSRIEIKNTALTVISINSLKKLNK